MTGLYTWAQSNISSACSYVYSTVSDGVASTRAAAAKVVTTALSYVFSEANQDRLFQGLDGFSQSLEIRKTFKSMFFDPKTRPVIWHAILNNLRTYIGTVLAYEYVIKSFLRQTIPNYKDSWAEIYGIEQLAYLYIFRVSLDVFVNNAFDYMSLATARYEESTAGEHMKPCRHCVSDPAAAVKADLMSTPYYYGNLAASFAMLAIPKVGEYIRRPLKTLVYGQSLVGYMPVQAKLCSDDRHKLLAQNNAYALGMGLSLMTGTWLLSNLVYSYTGVDSPYVKDALFNMVYMYHMLAASLRDKPLPGKKLILATNPKPNQKPLYKENPGFDVFYYPRKAVDYLLTDGAECVVPLLSAKQQGDLYAQAVALVNTRPVKIVRQLFVREDLQDFEKFMQRKSAQIFNDLHGDNALAVIHGIRALRVSRQITVYQFAKFVSSYLPIPLPVDEPTAQLLDNVVLNPQLLTWLDYIENTIMEAKRYSEQKHGVKSKSTGRLPPGKKIFIERNAPTPQPEVTAPHQPPAAPKSTHRVIMRGANSGSLGTATLFASPSPRVPAPASPIADQSSNQGLVL